MMSVMRRIGADRAVIVLLTLMVALLGLKPTAAMASPGRRTATYEGTGRQPLFSLSPGGPNGSFVLQFRVARNGRWVTQLHVWDLPVACVRPAGSYMDPSPDVGSARIQRDGTFRANLRPTTSGAQGSPVTLTGRFLSHGRARGTVRYRGRGPYKGCNADAIWTARVKPPLDRCSISPGPPTKDPASRSSARSNATRG